MSKDIRLAGLFNITSGTLLIALPLAVFLKHQAYPLWRPEILLIFVGVAVAGLILGLAMTVGRSPGLALISAALLTLMLDIQTAWFVGSLWLMPVVFIVLSVTGWLIRRHLSRMLTLMLGAMFLSVLVLPGGQPVVRVADPAEIVQPPKASENLPLLLHIILDEQIGVEGIPAQFDPHGEIADRVRDFYLDNSFQLFGRAYSRYYNTQESISNLLNFSSSDTPAAYFDGAFAEGDVLQRNAWFDYLHEQGFRIHTVESDYVRYFRRDADGNARNGDSCVAYTAEAIQPLVRAPFSAMEKIPFILGVYVKLPHQLTAYRIRGERAYRRLRASGVGARLHLPEIGNPGRTRVSPLAVREMMIEISNLLKTAQPGQAIFAHLLLPHYPYAFDRDCNPEPKANRWLSASDAAVFPRRNNQESRARRYPFYLQQVLCVQSMLGEMFDILQERGLWDDAIVVVHGDHGSRIDMGPPVAGTIDLMADQDYLDCYSTLFAVKQPGVPGGYFREQLPLDHLFEALLVGGGSFGDAELEAHPHIFVWNPNETMLQRLMPRFAHGVPIDQ